MGRNWGPQDPGGPHVGLMNFVIWDMDILIMNGTCHIRAGFFIVRPNTTRFCKRCSSDTERTVSNWQETNHALQTTFGEVIVSYSKQYRVIQDPSYKKINQKLKIIQGPFCIASRILELWAIKEKHKNNTNYKYSRRITPRVQFERVRIASMENGSTEL